MAGNEMARVDKQKEPSIDRTRSRLGNATANATGDIPKRISFSNRQTVGRERYSLTCRHHYQRADDAAEDDLLPMFLDGLGYVFGPY